MELLQASPSPEPLPILPANHNLLRSNSGRGAAQATSKAKQYHTRSLDALGSSGLGSQYPCRATVVKRTCQLSLR
jgi:hypothetical protein